MYTQKVMDHFKKPRNMGALKDYDAVGKVGNVVCGDVMYIYIKVDDEEKISDIGFKTMGCAAAIATTSMTTELAKGLSLDEALKITAKDVVDELGGLPPAKTHCSNLAAQGLHKAIENYRKGKPEGETRDELVDEFIKIPGISRKKAETLYDAGFHSLDELKRTSQEEFKAVDGISEGDVENIKNY